MLHRLIFSPMLDEQIDLLANERLPERQTVSSGKLIEMINALID